MATPDIPGAKRAGLPVDFERMARVGDSDLTPEERYALKTHGVCAQLQDHVFMVRARVPGGLLQPDQARALVGMARHHARDWVHLTTRQNVELHWVPDRSVPTVLAEVDAIGLTTRSACGHTLRNVMSAEEAGVGLDDPFDCLPDARAVSAAIVSRSRALNCELPSRINMAFGGSPRCRHDALLNDGGFVSVVRDGEAGYELWGGGSLGRSPHLAVRLHEFVPRADTRWRRPKRSSTCSCGTATSITRPRVGASSWWNASARSNSAPSGRLRSTKPAGVRTRSRRPSLCSERRARRGARGPAGGRMERRRATPTRHRPGVGHRRRAHG